jgi:divinyl chlorophyllide a 8-vinyl-reductase
MPSSAARPALPKRVFVLGGTGTIGRATVAALVARGHRVVCFLRPRAGADGELQRLSPGVELRFGDVTDTVSLATDGFRGEVFDALVSCLASRNGTARDAWAIDHNAHVLALAEARKAGVQQVVLLSAICVQKPKLAFQQAKRAFEQHLIQSGLIYSIVRPTAFFKSLSGQVERLKRGKPFLIFGDGRLTACKPISDRDLGAYLAECLVDESRWNRILPIGGPGEAITPREQGEMLFRLLDRPPLFRQVPVALMDAIILGLGTLGHLSAKAREKAELARIGRYYATESMLILDPATGRYDAALTPSTGSDRLEDHYARVLRGEATVDLGEHAVF